jgi:cysteine desulfurase
MMKYTDEEFGNSGSRTHIYGQTAKKAVNKAREQVAALVDVGPEEVIFTSGATESNNLAILGLLPYGNKVGKKHIISTAIEHKAVLEPLKEAEEKGFEVTYLKPNKDGLISVKDLTNYMRNETLLVSIMHVNNETGVIQPIDEVCKLLKDHECYIHTDAAQSFGKISDTLKNKRIDLISGSAHKLYSAKGIGTLITRTRNYETPPLKPLFFGGGQERGLRPGTLPVALLAAFGLASEMAAQDMKKRNQQNETLKKTIIKQLKDLPIKLNNPPELTNSTTINFHFDQFDSESAILALKENVCISNGSACTSASYTPSHVLLAQGLSKDESMSSIRLSWSHFNTEKEINFFSNNLRIILKNIL